MGGPALVDSAPYSFNWTLSPMLRSLVCFSRLMGGAPQIARQALGPEKKETHEQSGTQNWLGIVFKDHRLFVEVLRAGWLGQQLSAPPWRSAIAGNYTLNLKYTISASLMS